MTTIGVDATALFRQHPTGVDRAARGWVSGVADARPYWHLALAGWRGTAGQPSSLAATSTLHVAPIPRYAYRVAELARIPVPIDALAGVEAHAWLFPDFVRLPLRRDRPSVTVVHDVSFAIAEQFSHRMHRSYLTRQVTRALRMSTVAVVSGAIADEVASRYGVDRSRIAVLPNAVDHDRFRPIPEPAIDDARSRLGLDRPYILCVGALHARKNLIRLIAAYAGLGDATRWVDLLLVGSTNSHSAEVLAAIASYSGPGRVRHLGFVGDDDLPGLYCGAELAAVPSLYEGFGLPVLEAMACGTPVLTSTGGALQEVGGDAVDYADPRDVAAITAGLARLLGDAGRRRDRAAAGLQRAAGYTWQRSGILLAELLESLL